MKRTNPFSANNISRKNDNIPDVYVGIENHDFAILYYMQNVIQPMVMENGQLIKVPIIYGSPEKWKSVRIDGFYRSSDNQIMRPLIMFKRTGFDKRRTLTRNLDPDKPEMFLSFEQQYNKKNRYDHFSALQNKIPTRAIQNIIVPDYITLTYDLIVWTDYVEDMNKIIEAIQYGESTYWGDESTNFKFYTTVNSFSDTIEITSDTDRLLRTACNIVVQGYLIPNTIQKSIAQKSEIQLTNSQIVTEINSEVAPVSSGPTPDYSQLYYGSGIRSLSVNDIQLLTKITGLKENRSFEFNPSNQVLYFAYPKSFGILNSIKDENGYELITDWTLRDEIFDDNPPYFSGDTIPYYVYEFDNLVTITNFTINFKY